jgi:hypothetical protein
MVGVATASAYLLAGHGHLAPQWPTTLCGDAACHASSPLARFAFLITAIGIGFSDNRFVGRAAQWFTAVTATGPAPSPKWIRPVAAQLAIAAFGAVVPELDTPPEFIATASQSLYAGSIGAILWPAFWSVVIAALGSTAHAAFKASGNPSEWQ